MTEMIEAERRTRPTDEWTKKVCKIGQGHACCRYLTMSSGGWSCAKLTELRPYLDKRVADEAITARGDNCEGRAP